MSLDEFWQFSINLQSNLNRKILIAANPSTISVVCNLRSRKKTQPFKLANVDARSITTVLGSGVVDISNAVHSFIKNTTENYQNYFHFSLRFFCVYSLPSEFKLKLSPKIDPKSSSLGFSKTGIINLLISKGENTITNWFLFTLICKFAKNIDVNPSYYKETIFGLWWFRLFSDWIMQIKFRYRLTRLWFCFLLGEFWSRLSCYFQPWKRNGLWVSEVQHI